MPDTSFRSLVDNTAFVELRLLDRSEQVEKLILFIRSTTPAPLRNRMMIYRTMIGSAFCVSIEQTHLK